MTDPASNDRPEHERRADPGFRPRPERPEFAVEPLRARSKAKRTGVDVWPSVAAWTAVALAVAALAAVVLLNYDATRQALELAVSQSRSGATSSEVGNTVTVTLLGSAAVAAILLATAGAGLALARTRRVASGIVLAVTALAAICAFVLFRSFMSDAADIAAGALRWGPLVGAGSAATATIAAGIGLSRT